MKVIKEFTVFMFSIFFFFTFSFVSNVNAQEIKTAVRDCDPTKDTCDERDIPACDFNGKKIKVGESVTAYFESSVGSGGSCRSEVRTCELDSLSGKVSLSGTAQYASCKISDAKDCSYKDGTLKHGKKATLYKNNAVTFGQKCEGVEVSCNDGKLSPAGDFYGYCAEDKGKSCTKGKLTVEHQSSVIRYRTETVPYKKKCVPVKVACYNGEFSVDPDTVPYESCKPEFQEYKSCQEGNVKLQHGGTLVRFKANTVPFGNACERVIISCKNGNFSHTPSAYPHSSCSVLPEEPKKSCTSDKVNLVHGAVVERFKEKSVAYGQKCEKLKISCKDGQFSSDPNSTFESCTVRDKEDDKKPDDRPKRACYHSQEIRSLFFPTTYKLELQHGQSVTRYLQPTVRHGQACHAVNIACDDGNFSVHPSTAIYTECTQRPAPAPVHRWVNIPWEPNAPTLTHKEGCARAGLLPSTKYGGCASGRVYPSEGEGWDQIHYTHGKPHIINPHGGWQRKGTRLQRHSGPIQLGMYTNKIKCVPEKKVSFFFTLRDDLAWVWGTHDVVVAYLCTDTASESSELPMETINPAPVEDPCNGGCGQ